MPYFKLGLIFCLNRPMQLYHIQEPIFDKKKLPSTEQADLTQYLKQINPKAEYMAMQPRFSSDFSKLAYIARDAKFLSHTTCYQLKQLQWPIPEGLTTSETVIDRMADYPTDD